MILHARCRGFVRFLIHDITVVSRRNWGSTYTPVSAVSGAALLQLCLVNFALSVDGRRATYTERSAGSREAGLRGETSGSSRFCVDVDGGRLRGRGSGKDAGGGNGS